MSLENTDDEAAYLRDRLCQMCTGEDGTSYDESCRHPGELNDCRPQAAVDLLLAAASRKADRP